MKKPKKTVLVVEDEGALQSAIKSKLVTEGFDVVTARASKQALDYLKDGVKIDAIWLDHYLYGKDSGLDFVTALKKNRLQDEMPIFVISNTASSDKIQAYLKLGVQKCYAKVDHGLGEIIGEIKDYLKKGKLGAVS